MKNYMAEHANLVSEEILPVKEAEQFKCEYCSKTSYSSPGLKGPMTKMHNDRNNKNIRIIANKRKSQDDVKNVVESLL